MNIKDYLKYYKNETIKDVPWNDLDTLLCAIISYIPMKSFKTTKTLDDICDYMNRYKPTNKEIMALELKEILPLMKSSIRYKNMKFRNLINVVDDNTQFGAITCIISPLKIVAFKGSDGSIIGWEENFRLAYAYPTYTQKLATTYLNSAITALDTHVFVTGHSKGGNLAAASSMEIPKTKFKHIERIVNFDGPGFKLKEFKSAKYKAMSKKLINIMPSYSYIGSLMYNSNYKTIETKTHTPSLHYPLNWNTYGNIFIEEKLSDVSKKIHTTTSEKMQVFEDKELQDILEPAMKVLDYKKKERVSSFSIKDMKAMLDFIKNIDTDTSKEYYKLMSSLLKIQFKKKEEKK